MLLNDLMKQFNESVEQTGTKFTGYWKAKDPAPAGKKMVGGESIKNEEVNPTDKVTMDVPLFIRMMEYAREDAKDDMDLHSVTDRAITLMKEHEYLCMDNYNDLVGGEQPTNEEKKGLYYNVNKRKKAGTSRPKGHSKAPSDQDWKDAAKTAKKEGIGEDKKKGADGKSCWKGYRYAGTEDGKDKCVPVKKDK